MRRQDGVLSLVRLRQMDVLTNKNRTIRFTWRLNRLSTTSATVTTTTIEAHPPSDDAHRPVKRSHRTQAADASRSSAGRVSFGPARPSLRGAQGEG